MTTYSNSNLNEMLGKKLTSDLKNWNCKNAKVAILTQV